MSDTLSRNQIESQENIKMKKIDKKKENISITPYLNKEPEELRIALKQGLIILTRIAMDLEKKFFFLY